MWRVRSAVGAADIGSDILVDRQAGLLYQRVKREVSRSSHSVVFQYRTLVPHCTHVALTPIFVYNSSHTKLTNLENYKLKHLFTKLF